MPASPYTRERLAEAARSSQTLSEALERLGVDPKSPSRRYLLGRMQRMDIDTSHFAREGVRWTREVLEPVVAASTSMCEVLRRLGLAVVGGHHSHISRRVRALGLDTAHFTRPDRAGETRPRRTPQALLSVQDPADTRRVPGGRLRRAMVALGVSERCTLCGTALSGEAASCHWKWTT